MKDIFISYKSDEYNTARWVRDYLVKRGLSVWMAPEDIPGGGSYAAYIPDAIENCKAFVLILSDRAQNSKWVPRELDQAINADKEILPFMIEKTELNREFRFYLANIQGYPAYTDMPGQLMEMTSKIMTIPGITVNKPEENKPAVKPAQPKPPAKSEPDFSGLGFKTEAEKFRYAVSEGMRVYGDPESTAEQRRRAFELLEWAARMGDPEASFRFGAYLVNGKIKLKDVDSKERGMFYIDRAACNGNKGARLVLDEYCTLLYQRQVGERIPAQAPAPLRDFDGWRFKINHNGRHLPVNAVLDFDGRVNTLYLTANVSIMLESDEVADWGRMENAVKKGFKAWEGSYTVFGGQRLDVVVNVNFCDRIMGVINIMSARGDMAKNAMRITGLLGSTARKRGEDAFTNYRTFSMAGLKGWSVKSNKSIMLYDATGRFDDYEQIKREIRYTFGTMLGLGDMAFSDNGKKYFVPKGTYPELDPYYIEDGFYNLVMCDGWGMISNNDIEMVILAFSENKMQYYVEDSVGNKPSKALGRGN